MLKIYITLSKKAMSILIKLLLKFLHTLMKYLTYHYEFWNYDSEINFDNFRPIYL